MISGPGPLEPCRIPAARPVISGGWRRRREPAVDRFARAAPEMAPACFRAGSAVSIGVFDGVHRGHQSLLSGLVAEASGAGLTPAVATFDPHPLRVLAPEQAPRMLTSVAHRVEVLEELGIGVVGVMPFAEIREMEADRFVTEVLLDRLKAEMVLVGENFQFGRGGAGSPATLRRGGDETRVLPEGDGPSAGQFGSPRRGRPHHVLADPPVRGRGPDRRGSLVAGSTVRVARRGDRRGPPGTPARHPHRQPGRLPPTCRSRSTASMPPGPRWTERPTPQLSTSGCGRPSEGGIDHRGPFARLLGGSVREGDEIAVRGGPDPPRSSPTRRWTS